MIGLIRGWLTALSSKRLLQKAPIVKLDEGSPSLIKKIASYSDWRGDVPEGDVRRDVLAAFDIQQHLAIFGFLLGKHIFRKGVDLSNVFEHLGNKVAIPMVEGEGGDLNPYKDKFWEDMQPLSLTPLGEGVSERIHIHIRMKIAFSRSSEERNSIRKDPWEAGMIGWSHALTSKMYSSIFLDQQWRDFLP
ncbi:uncharacterized protein A4U43_C07F31660 [Asparagus officinalis]|uniref:Uncharacterized protein n=1 Tax=Asparagus officinalis TaxID=4686 RepID=A0A5P1EGB1_ASPOF|nr:uncharacterized protein A4U43_C07F31660 [Asparagus officinalis]